MKPKGKLLFLGSVGCFLIILVSLFACSTPDEPTPGPTGPTYQYRLSDIGVSNAKNLMIGAGSSPGTWLNSFRTLADDPSQNLLFKVTDDGKFGGVAGINMEIISNTNGTVTTNISTNVVSRPLAIYDVHTNYLMLVFKAEAYEAYLINKNTGKAYYLDADTYGVPWDSELYIGGGGGNYSAKFDKVQTDQYGRIYYISVKGKDSLITTVPRSIIMLNVANPDNIVLSTLVANHEIEYFFVNHRGDIIYMKADPTPSTVLRRVNSGETSDVPSEQYWLGWDDNFYYRIDEDTQIPDGKTNYVTNIEPNPVPPPDSITNVSTNTSPLDISIIHVWYLNPGYPATLYASTTNYGIDGNIFPQYIHFPACYKLYTSDWLYVVGTMNAYKMYGGTSDFYETLFFWDAKLPADRGFIWTVTNDLRMRRAQNPEEGLKLLVNAGYSENYVYIVGYGRNVADTSFDVDTSKPCLVKLNDATSTVLLAEGTYEEILFSVSPDDYVLFSGLKSSGKWDIGEFTPSNSTNWITNDVDYSLKDMENMS